MEFSERLKILRAEANLTQEELAGKLMVSRQAVSNYEQGRGYPSIDILVSISKLFNISLDELLSSGINKRIYKYFFASLILIIIGGIISIFSAYFFG